MRAELCGRQDRGDVTEAGVHLARSYRLKELQGSPLGVLSRRAIGNFAFTRQVSASAWGITREARGVKAEDRKSLCGGLSP